MTFDNNPRPMIHGSWKCSNCGAEITELPFEPSPDRPINCKECWSKKKNSGRDNNRSFAPRQMVQGSWKCAECGAEITELPFQPKDESTVHCKECWMKKRNDR